MIWRKNSLSTSALRVLAAALLGGTFVAAGGPVDVPLVVTQLPHRAGEAAAAAARDSAAAGRFEGARLVLVSPDQSIRILSTGMDSACDPNVSFDGKSLLFAGKQTRSGHWRIYEVTLSDGTPRAVSPADQDARQPIYATTLFTLDSPEPWFTIIYSARESFLNEAAQTLASSLYNVTLDGKELRRLTFNPNPNRDPFQMWDGRVIYSAERHPTQPDGTTKTGLHAIHVEGADMELFGGELGKRIQRTPCATAGGLIVFIESEQPTPDGSGQLACVEERRPHVTYRPLTDDKTYTYAHPSPLGGNRILAARRPLDASGSWGIVSFDADTRRTEPLFDSPEFHELQAVVVKPRQRPDGHSTVVTTTNNTGLFYGLNCYDADARMAPYLQTGMVKRVRFIEGMVRPTNTSSAMPARGLVVPRRLVGEAPVEADGSFNVEVPADTPLLLQTLDERGLALGNCGWIWVKPKEKRGCIGCHEDPERIPENEYVLALRRPSTQLTLPSDQRRDLSFLQDIVPMLKSHCATADCHGGHDTQLHLPLTAESPSAADLERAYNSLLVSALGVSNKTSSAPMAGRYVEAGRARTSWIVWQLAGTNTARPWDSSVTPDPRRTVKMMPPSGKGTPLSPEQLRMLIQWIDLGAQFESVKPAESELRKLTETP